MADPSWRGRLNLPARTWYNYETGVTVPAEVLLSFIDQTGTNPVWLLTGQGPKYRRGLEDMVLAESDARAAHPAGPGEARDGSPTRSSSSPRRTCRATVPPTSWPSIWSRCRPWLARASAVPEGHILAYRQWIPHPRETVAVQLQDDAMHPILPAGSVVAVDRAVRDPQQLQGKLVAAAPEGRAMICWLEITGRHLILRPNQPSREHPMVPIELENRAANAIVGQVVWSWSKFANS